MTEHSEPDEHHEANAEATEASAGDAAPVGAGSEQPPRSMLSGMANSIAGAAGPMINAALRPVGELTSGARRVIGERSGARVRRARRMARQPLPNLWDIHPEAHRASVRELGLRTVPVEEVAGTAVEGPTQRGGDFLPLRQLRGRDWRARWQRILAGIDQLATLPPVDLLKFADRYWIVDGHNRVAAALYSGQIAVDANVVELRLPGVPPTAAEGNLAPFLEGSRDVREAGTGRFRRTSIRPTAVLPEHPLDEHPEHPEHAGHGHANEGPRSAADRPDDPAVTEE